MGIPTVHSLPLDRPRPVVQEFDGSSHTQLLDADLYQDLQALAKRQNVTMFMLLNSALATLISRYSRETDIVIGSPIANREDASLQPMIGFFVQLLCVAVECRQHLQSYYKQRVLFTQCTNISKYRLRSLLTSYNQAFKPYRFSKSCSCCNNDKAI